MEGAVAEDGRGASIWDTFCATPGRVRGGDTGAEACDQYHRFAEDVALMASLGARAYRFSVAWPRIQPDGRGRADPRGLDHYRRLVDTLNGAGIEPVLTLYHWDLPQALEDAGGWPSRDTAFRFADYAALVHDAIGDQVRYWITLNEPWVVAWLGYDLGVHAPGRRDEHAAVAATHHLLLAHGLARDAVGVPVGITLNLEPHRPASDDPEDERLATLAELHMNALFLDPLVGRGYPAPLVERFPALAGEPLVHDGDLAIADGPLAFLGVNYYRPQTVGASPARGERPVAVPGALGWSVVPPGARVTAMGWPIEPAGLTEILVRLHREYAPAAMFLTENGAAFDDASPEGRTVEDTDRIAYLRDHVEAARAALDEGVPLIGYLVWSLLDNFEWAEGYARRFGLVGVDRDTMQRTPKASAAWFRDLISGGGGM